MEVKSIIDVEIEDMFCKDGLYSRYSIDRKDIKHLEKISSIIEERFKLSFHCISCEKERLFFSDEGKEIRNDIERYTYMVDNLYDERALVSLKESIRNLIFVNNRNFARIFYCSYCERDTVVFNFRIEDNYLMKVGQFPSLADLTREDTKKYKNILNRDDYSDLNRAIGLNSHGVGAGSLIYLRRIFENLVKKAYEESVEEDKWNEDLDFYRITMEEKIKNLEGYLPEFVLEHHYIYGILSKGVHELSEQECKGYFDILRESIFIILDEEIKRVEGKKRIDTVSKALSKVNSMLGEKNKGG